MKNKTAIIDVNLTEKQLKIKALKKHLELNDEAEANQLINSGDYLVLTDEEAQEKTGEYIEDSLWAFNASFILSECDLDLSGKDSLRSMQEKSCEIANDFIKSLIVKTCGLERFIESAIAADGRGHFMSSYDGEESEEIVNAITFYIYRIN